MILYISLQRCEQCYPINVDLHVIINVKETRHWRNSDGTHSMLQPP